MSYGPCIDCHNPARNKCSQCKRNYCATCRDAAGVNTCKVCRDANKAKRQQSKIAQSHSKAVQSGATYTGTTAWMPTPQPLPAHVAAQYSAPITPVAKAQRASRKALYMMDDREFESWRERTEDAIRDTQTRGSAYLSRRAARGTRTSTDIAMERDQILYEDLLDALREMKTLYNMATAGAGPVVASNTSGSNTQFLLSYDSSLPPDDPDKTDELAPRAQPKP